MSINAYLNFNGNTEEVLEFYRSVLGGEVEIARFAGSPAAEYVPADWGNKVMHGRLKLPDALIMASDATEDNVGKPGDNIALCIEMSDEGAAETIFSKLSAGGEVTMPLEKTFWAAKFGMLTDRYGIRWMVNAGTTG